MIDFGLCNSFRCHSSCSVVYRCQFLFVFYKYQVFVNQLFLYFLLHESGEVTLDKTEPIWLLWLPLSGSQVADVLFEKHIGDDEVIYFRKVQDLLSIAAMRFVAFLHILIVCLGNCRQAVSLLVICVAIQSCSRIQNCSFSSSSHPI